MDRLPENIALKKRSWADWRKFAQKVELFLKATKKTKEDEETKVAILLACGGDIVLDEYNAKYGPEEKPKFEEVIEELGRKFADGESEHYLSHVFRERVQRPEESAAEWITDLRLKVKPCNYGTLADRMVRDQIIYGVANKETRRELLKVAKLSAEEAVRICLAMESSRTQLAAFGERRTDSVAEDTQTGEEELNQLERRSQRRRQEVSTSRRANQNGGPSFIQQNRREKFERPTTHFGSKKAGSCRSCGNNHSGGFCPAKGRVCAKCGRLNHFAAVCQVRRKAVNALVEDSDSDEDVDPETREWCCAIGSKDKRMVFVSMRVREAEQMEQPMRFQVDCGASCNVIARRLIPNAVIDAKRCPPIRAYNKTTIHTLGTATVHATNVKTGQTHRLRCVVVDESYQPILGRFDAERLGIIHFNYEKVDILETESQLKSIEDVFRSYPDVFNGSLGRFPGKVKLHLKEESVPSCNVSCKISPHLKEELSKTLSRLTEKKVIRKVEEPTEWVNRLSIQIKKSGELRLCLDPRRLNQCLVREVYHTPALDEILPDLSGARVFSKFDLADGFWHCELDEGSIELTTFQTPSGRYQFLRLPFGLNVSPEIFYKRLVQLLEGLQGTYALADDVLICGRGNNDEEARKDHDKNLKRFLQRCQEKGIKLNRKKATLRTTNTKFFGFVLTEKGVQIDPDKQKAVASMKEPKDQVALKSFLGMLSHVSRFIPRLAEVVAPLREVCRKDSDWSWGERQRKGFREATTLVSQSMALAFFNPTAAIEIECDSSQYALGAALIQNDKPVYFASRTLSTTETRYAQIEKELLAVVYSLKRFHYFVFPKEVTVFTDHRPLINIMLKPLGEVPLRLQKMLMAIQRYNVKLIFRPGREMKFADALSRCPMEGTPHHVEEVSVIRVLPMRDSTLKRVAEEARSDRTYQEVIRQTRLGWPDNKRKVSAEIREFFPYRGRLTLEKELVLKDDAILIPRKMRRDISQLLCSAHLSPKATVERAKTCVFWPNMKHDIEQHVESCEGCQAYPNAPRKEPLRPHEVPVRPWQKIAIDIAQTPRAKFLVAVCYYSNIIMVTELPEKPTTKSITSRLARLFSEYGVCEILMSDADPLFRASDFKDFVSNWQLEHKMSSPHFHQSNGKVEAAVAIVKKIMMRSSAAGQDWRKGLLAYNDTPQRKLGGATPGQLFLSRRLRTGLPTPKELLRPTTSWHFRALSARRTAIEQMKRNHDKGSRELRPIRAGAAVRIRPTKLGEHEWQRGKVVRKLGNRSYVIQTGHGEITRNRKHLVEYTPRQAEKASPYVDTENLESKAGIVVPRWLWSRSTETDSDRSEDERDVRRPEEEFVSAEEDTDGEDGQERPEPQERVLRDRAQLRPPEKYGR